MQKLQQSLPIIPWMGGKRRLAKHLLPMFPEHSCYVELFAGGAALFFLRPTPAKDRLKGVYIEHESWERCFKRYDREHTFFYADPPYWQTAGYDSAFDWSQYELLAKAVAESKGKFMLSINDHPDIRALFTDFRITQLELAYTVGRDKTGKTSGELVICNW